MDDDRSLCGEATLTFADSMVGEWGGFILLEAGVGLLLAFVYLLGWIATLSDGEWLRIRETPLIAARDALLGATPFWAITLAVFTLLMLYSMRRRFRRMPEGRRRIAYEADASGLTVRDGAGLALAIPWSAVERADEGRGLLTLRLSGGGRRQVLLRAFAPGDRAVLAARARRGAKAGAPAATDRND